MKQCGRLRLGLLLACTAAAGFAQAVDAVNERRGETHIDGYASHQALSAAFPDWKETGVRLVHRSGAHVLRGELVGTRRWDERGAYASAGDTYEFNPLWYGSLAVGFGDGASYLPRVRVDAFLNRKLLAQNNLVSTVGIGYYKAPDGHIDRSLGLGAVYYFPMPLVIQGEVRFTTSNPGSVDTRQQFLAATWGREKQTLLTARHGWGSEGYQVIGRGSALVNFRSHETSIGVRHWMGANWGGFASLERYKNPTYERRGVTLGIFWQAP